MVKRKCLRSCTCFKSTSKLTQELNKTLTSEYYFSFCYFIQWYTSKQFGWFKKFKGIVHSNHHHLHFLRYLEKCVLFVHTMKAKMVQNHTAHHWLSMYGNKQTLFLFEWTVPLNDKSLDKDCTLSLHLAEKVFVYNAIIKTGASSPDCHYCLGEGDVTGKPGASKRGCECNLNEAEESRNEE